VLDFNINFLQQFTYNTHIYVTGIDIDLVSIYNANGIEISIFEESNYLTIHL